MYLQTSSTENSERAAAYLKTVHPRLQRADAQQRYQLLARLFFAFSSEPSEAKASVYSDAISGFSPEAISEAVHGLARGEGVQNPDFLPSSAALAEACRRATARIADDVMRRTISRAPTLPPMEELSPREAARREARAKAASNLIAAAAKGMSMDSPRPLSGMLPQDKRPTLGDTKRQLDEMAEQILAAGEAARMP
jgi:hypothetical protein